MRNTIISNTKRREVMPLAKKTKKDVQPWTARLPKKLFKELQKLAELQHRSLNGLVVFILENYVKQENKDNS